MFLQKGTRVDLAGGRGKVNFFRKNVIIMLEVEFSSQSVQKNCSCTDRFGIVHFISCDAAYVHDFKSTFLFGILNGKRGIRVLDIYFCKTCLFTKTATKCLVF